MSEIEYLENLEEWNKNRIKRIKMLKELGTPDALIERDCGLSSMTAREAKAYIAKRDKEQRKRLNEYMRENPLKEEVVKKLFDAFDKLLNAPTVIPMAYSLICFNMELDPLKYVDEREFHMGVYDPLIDSFHQTYIEKWKKDIEEYYGR